MTAIESLSKFLLERGDEVAYAKHGFHAGARLQQVLEALNRGQDRVKIDTREDLSLPNNRVLLISHQRQDLEAFDL
jgi:hypothetical protein